MTTPTVQPQAPVQATQNTTGSVPQGEKRDLQGIYAELDRIRQEQIALATDHVNLSSLQAEGLNLADLVGLDSAKYQRNSEKFAKKEADVAALMDTVGSAVPAPRARLTREFHSSTSCHSLWRVS